MGALSAPLAPFLRALPFSLHLHLTLSSSTQLHARGAVFPASALRSLGLMRPLPLGRRRCVGEAAVPGPAPAGTDPGGHGQGHGGTAADPWRRRGPQDSAPQAGPPPPSRRGGGPGGWGPRAPQVSEVGHMKVENQDHRNGVRNPQGLGRLGRRFAGFAPKSKYLYSESQRLPALLSGPT